MGRLFQTTMIEPAGGENWSAVVRRPRDEAEKWERTFEGSGALESSLSGYIHLRLDDLLPFPGWFEIGYDPTAGSLRLSRAMQSRRDIPTAERFAKYLDTLDGIAAANRDAQIRQGTAAGTGAAGSGITV